MKILYPLFLMSILIFGACSYLSSAKKVECCEKKAACCYDQMCCLPRYAVAAGLEPKPFTTNIPVYGTAQDQDLEPPPGAVIVKEGWLSKFNPFRNSQEQQKPTPQPQDEQPRQDTTTEEKKDDKGSVGSLWPF